MFAIDHPTATPTLPAPAAAGSPGFFTGGDPATSVVPTVLTADFMNGLQVELLTVLAAAGLTPSKSNNGQLLQALITLIQANGASFVADSGSANALVLTPTIPVTSYTLGLGFRIRVAASNTGAATVNVSGVGVKPIKRNDGTPLKRGDLIAGEISILTYDGTNFQLVDLPQPATAIPRYAHASASVTVGVYHVDTSGGVSIVLTLPSVIDEGDTITFVDPNANWSVNNFTLARNGQTIMGQASDLVVDMADQMFSIRWTGSTWSLV